MTKPPAIGSTSIARRSPSTSSRNRMATSREPFPPPRERPLRDRGPLERERFPAGQPAARDGGCRDRSDAFLPRAAPPKARCDPQLRDHRRPQVPLDELLGLEQRAMERQVGLDAADLVRSEEHTSELQSQSNLVCRLLLEK